MHVQCLRDRWSAILTSDIKMHYIYYIIYIIYISTRKKGTQISRGVHITFLLEWHFLFYWNAMFLKAYTGIFIFQFVNKNYWNDAGIFTRKYMNCSSQKLWENFVAGVEITGNLYRRLTVKLPLIYKHILPEDFGNFGVESGGSRSSFEISNDHMKNDRYLEI